MQEILRVRWLRFCARVRVVSRLVSCLPWRGVQVAARERAGARAGGEAGRARQSGNTAGRETPPRAGTGRGPVSAACAGARERGARHRLRRADRAHTARRLARADARRAADYRSSRSPPVCWHDAATREPCARATARGRERGVPARPPHSAGAPVRRARLPDAAAPGRCGAMPGAKAPHPATLAMAIMASAGPRALCARIAAPQTWRS